MASDRRLVAIMFTDWVGFTTLAQDDEQHALTLLETQRGLLRPIFARFRGAEIKTIGDAFLVEFPSALEATRCAEEIQQLLHDRNEWSPVADRIRLRIGIHLGDVVHEAGDVLGDAINIASRIEPLAEPGGICVSDPVFSQVRNKVSHALTKLPTPSLKNLRFPIEVYKVEMPWDRPTAHVDPRPASVARRLAVLPLANMSPDPQDAFFADGLTEEIISELSRVPALRVIARTSVLRFREGKAGVAEIGKELRVGTVLEGSVRRAGNRVRVTAQLIDAATEEHLWSDKFDRELDDIFAIQTEIAKEVATALGIALPPPAAAPRRAPPSLEAFKSYLRGRALWNRRAPDPVRAALRAFEEALQVDPEFAEAYSGLADCYLILMDTGAVNPIEGAPKARAAAERAIGIDETLGEAHASLGLSFIQECRWIDAEREFRRAVELNPMYASAHQWFYMALLTQGRRDEARREVDLAEEADPLSPTILWHLAYMAWIEGRDEIALANWRRAAELGGDPALFHLVMICYHVHRSELAKAATFLPGIPPEGGGWLGTAAPAVALALLGRREEATRALGALQGSGPQPYVSTAALAWFYAALGEKDRFFEWLFRSLEGQNKAFDFVTFPLFEPLRADPRFREYLRRIDLA